MIEKWQKEEWEMEKEKGMREKVLFVLPIWGGLDEKSPIGSEETNHVNNKSLS